MVNSTGVKEISVKQLTKKIISSEQVFILDVRTRDSFDDWKIEGKNVEIINLPYKELKDMEELKKILPKQDPIYVVCAKGGSSIRATQQLVEAGFENSHSVKGGMNAWSEHLEPVLVAELSQGRIYQFVRIGKGCLSYIIESNGEGVIVDTNRMIEQYEEFMSEHNIKLKYLVDTHLHADHISGARVLSDKTGADYYLPSKDAKEVTFSFTPLEDKDEIHVGDVTIRALYSPGHTIGSTSLIVDDKYLLTGDILFIDSIGRPDLAGKAEDWVSDLRETLYRKYKELTDELVVLPAHYMGINEMNEDGTISKKLGTLYKENHGLNITDEDVFRRTVTENLPPQPNSYTEIRETNMGKLNPNYEKQLEMEIGPNRCAVR